MNSDRIAEALFLVLALTLPLSALIARRLPRERTLRLALLWGVIFLAAALIAGVLPLRADTPALHNIYYQTEGVA